MKQSENFSEITLIKIGGSLTEEESSLELLCRKIEISVRAGRKIVIVHGGGKIIEKYQLATGLKPLFLNGLRITDKKTMEISEMVLSGLTNKALASHFSSAGMRAVGISGRDARLIQAEKLSDGINDYGRVGKITGVNPEILEVLLSAGFLPVVSPIGNDKNNRALNINADTAASEIAVALKAKLLVFFSDVDGILDGEQLLRKVSTKEIEILIMQKKITGGMIPKVCGMIRAIESGVGSVKILNGKRIAEFISPEASENYGTELYI